MIAHINVCIQHEKAAVTDIVWNDDTHQYIIDGGSLLHRISWGKNKTYGEIACSYSRFVLSTYGKSIVVFDGYKDGPSTKDMTHMRRSEKCSQRLIVFTENTKFTVSKEDFLSNLSNKDQFLLLMGGKLKQEGCEVIFAEEDADLQIAKSSVDASFTKKCHSNW